MLYKIKSKYLRKKLRCCYIANIVHNLYYILQVYKKNQQL